MASTTSPSTAAVTATATFDAGNLANGLFTDFAPLLALFGDEVTKQFLATSMGWGDDILLALAPIGIITVIISAIRVSGYPLMKSIIGRARDSPDDEEKDILSSTSTNVREIWNGQRIIRQSGDSQTTEFVFTRRKEVERSSFFAGLWTLQSALDGDTDLDENFTGKSIPLYCIKKSKNWTFPWRSFQKDTEGLSADDQSAAAKKLANRLTRRSPNLTLNMKAAIPSQIKVWIFTFIGAMVQGVVFFFNGLVVYHYRWPRGGYVVASYGYPVWASGTACIAIGLCLCTRVVEYSTTECTVEPLVSGEEALAMQQADATQGDQWKRNTRAIRNDSGCSGQDTGFRVVRLQKTIQSMNLPAFAIFNEEKNPRVVISRRTIMPPGFDPAVMGSENLENEGDDCEARLVPKSHLMAIITIIGTTLTLAGFILQNIGTRELHWSAGVAQLIATLILVILRAWLRRHLGDLPSETMPLKKGFEASHLASHIHSVERLMMHVGTYQSTLSDESSNSSKEITGDNLRLFPGQIQPLFDDLGHNETEGEQDPAFEGLVLAYRVITSQLLLSHLQPGLSDISDTATKVYKTFEEILTLFSFESLTWCHKVSFKGQSRFAPPASRTTSADNIVGLINVELQAFRIGSSIGGRSFIERGGCIDMIQALLSLSVYHYTKSQKIPDSKDLLIIVGGCQADADDDIQTVFEKKKSVSNSLLGAAGTGSWFRQSDGKVSPLEYTHPRAGGEEEGYNATIFGMSYSSIEYDDQGKFCLPEGGREVVKPMVDGWLSGGLPSTEQIIRIFALELVSNFLKQLISQRLMTIRAPPFSRESEKYYILEEKYLQRLEQIFMGNGFYPEAIRIAIVSAFLYHDIFLPPPAPGSIFA